MNKDVKISFKNVIKFIFKIPKIVEIKMIIFYQKHISKSLGRRCIFYPTCSEYTKQAIDKYGIIKGNILGMYRILRCNPFSQGGVDKLR